jgi:putative membrane protein
LYWHSTARRRHLGLLIWLALIFGLINAIVRPITTILSLPLIVLSLGIFILVLNTLLFAFTGWLGAQFGVGSSWMTRGSSMPSWARW